MTEAAPEPDQPEVDPDFWDSSLEPVTRRRPDRKPLPAHLSDWRGIARAKAERRYAEEREAALKQGGWRFGLWRSRNRRLIGSRRFDERTG